MSVKFHRSLKVLNTDIAPQITSQDISSPNVRCEVKSTELIKHLNEEKLEK